MTLPLGALEVFLAAWAVFMSFAIGATVGSFLNVVAYRLPRGEGLVSPPSHCPVCETRLGWYDNIPVLGWFLLSGRCRYCRARISVQYPVIEAAVGVLFALVYVLWFMDDRAAARVWLDFESLRPMWSDAGVARTWPYLLIVWLMVAGLTSATLIDARTFTIPLIVVWVPMVFGLVAHPLHALVVGSLARDQSLWTIPTLTGPAVGAAVGATIGLVFANVLVAKGVLARSFDVDPAQEPGNEPKHDHVAFETDEPVAPAGPARSDFVRFLIFVSPALSGLPIGWLIAERTGLAVGGAIGLILGIALRAVWDARHPDQGPHPDEPEWLHHHAPRREIMKEVLFLVPVVVLGAGGWFAWQMLVGDDPGAFWLRALGGALGGAIIAGGLIWVVRIAGTMAFGKEAMGLGDVHLMAAVGACIGWWHGLLAFLVAPFFGLAWAAGAFLFGRFFRISGGALPYGPHLAAATILVMLLEQPILDAIAALVPQTP